MSEIQEQLAAINIEIENLKETNKKNELALAEKDRQIQQQQQVLDEFAKMIQTLQSAMRSQFTQFRDHRDQTLRYEQDLSEYKDILEQTEFDIKWLKRKVREQVHHNRRFQGVVDIMNSLSQQMPTTQPPKATDENQAAPPPHPEASDQGEPSPEPPPNLSPPFRGFLPTSSGRTAASRRPDPAPKAAVQQQSAVQQQEEALGERYPALPPRPVVEEEPVTKQPSSSRFRPPSRPARDKPLAPDPSDNDKSISTPTHISASPVLAMRPPHKHHSDNHQRQPPATPETAKPQQLALPMSDKPSRWVLGGDAVYEQLGAALRWQQQVYENLLPTLPQAAHPALNLSPLGLVYPSLESAPARGLLRVELYWLQRAIINRCIQR